VPEFLQAHTQQWLEHLRREGYPQVRALGAGVEGAVYDLGDGTVAKVWGRRHETELLLMQRFYADLASTGLPFATPEILAIKRVNAMAVTHERKLPGTPLQRRLKIEDRHLDPDAVRCVIEVLQALAAVRATSSMRQLRALDEDLPFWAGADNFQTALLDLLRRRVARFGYLISQQLPDFDRRYASLQEKLAAMAQLADTAIHGDLVAGNILVDQDARPLAVLDFGFLTTAGDPRLDAAISAAVMNMYGPHAPAITAELTAQIAATLNYPVDTLLIYQAAYAVATSNAFTPDGSDGHFAWCLAQLRRADITAALGLQLSP